MRLLDLEQGSNEWLEVRSGAFCASEAAAMMGASPHMTRTQLLDEKKGAARGEPSSAQLAIFKNGHDAEESARALFETAEFLDYPPAVGVRNIDGLKTDLLASFDGLSSERMSWEHKLWNKTLPANVENKVLEPLHFWQLEHQMLVNNEAESCVFNCSDGGAINNVRMTYYSIPELRAELIAGWKQFEKDLAAHEIKAKPEKIIAKKQDSFPSIECRVDGSTVVSNLGEYIPLIQSLADEQMSIILESDQDFADKDAFNKNVKKGRATLKLKASEIETAFVSLAEFNGYVKKADSILQKLQSHGEKQIKESKEAKKQFIIISAESLIQAHLAELGATISGIQIQNISADWQAIIKGKRNFEKMQEAVESEIAKLKIQSNEIAATIRRNLDSLDDLAKEHKFLFSDHAELVLKNNDDLVNLIKTRIAEHEKAEAERIEQERQRIQKEEELKARREAEIKLKADAEAERERIRKEELIRLSNEHAEKIRAIDAAQDELNLFAFECNDRIQVARIEDITGLFKPDWVAELKGKRSIESIEAATSAKVAQVKAAVNSKIDLIEKNAAFYIVNGQKFKFLFSDLCELITCNHDSFTSTITERIKNHEDEAEERIANRLATEKENKKKREAKALQEEKSVIQPISSSEADESCFSGQQAEDFAVKFNVDVCLAKRMIQYVLDNIENND